MCALSLLLAFGGFYNPQAVEAQTLRDFIQSRAVGTDSLLVKAVTPSLSIVRQQYRLLRDGEYFGKNNMPYYGESYTLAVKISGYTILQNQVVTPWLNDADYIRVNQTEKYIPVHFWSYQRALNDSVYKPVEWELDSHYTRPADTDSLLYKNEDTVSDFGLSVDNSLGEKFGYMIWAYSSTNVQDSAMHVSLRQYNYRVDESSDNSKVFVTPSEPDKILGGIFVVPFFESGGIIRIALSGVATKTVEGKWVLCLINNE